MSFTIFQAADENILREAVWSSDVAPDASYSLTTLLRLDPAARLRWTGSGSPAVTAVRLTATLEAPARGDLIAVPGSNADSLTVSNGNGFSAAVPLPTMPRHRIPLTAILDATGIASAGTRTDNVWHYDFTFSGDLILCAALPIYSPKTAFEFTDFQYGGSISKKALGIDQANDYGVRYRQDYRTQLRWVDFTKLANGVDADALEAAYDGSRGSLQPGLLWLDPTVNDALFGTFGETFAKSHLAPDLTGGDFLYTIAFRFDELSKGKPLP